MGGEVDALYLTLNRKRQLFKTKYNPNCIRIGNSNTNFRCKECDFLTFYIHNI